MIESVIKNEIYQSIRYIKSKDLIQDDLVLIGTPRVCEYLRATTAQLGVDAPLYPTAEQSHGSFSRMWYVLEAED